MLDLKLPTHRRGFLGSLAAGAAAFGFGSLVPRALVAQPGLAGPAVDDPQLDAWLGKLTGKHKQAYDMPDFHGGVGFAWSRVFYITNKETGVADKDINVVVILRHDAMPLAMTDDMWAKYKFGELFKLNDPETNAPAVRNFMYKVPAEKLPLPAMDITGLMASGTLFGVCNMAIKFYAGQVAKSMSTSADDIANEWRAHLIPDVQILPSGVWAVNRVQERGCSYCFAG